MSLAAAGVLIAAVLRAELTAQVDRQLVAGVDAPNTVLPPNTGSSGLHHGLGPAFYTAFRSDDGLQVRRQLDGAQLAPPGLPAISSHQASQSVEPFTVSSANGTKWRMVARPATLNGQDGTFFAAMPLTDSESTLSFFLVRFGTLALLLIALMVLIGYFAVGRAFRPLREVEAVAYAFGQGDTSRRVVDVVPGTEVGRLGGSVNDMLDEIESTLAAREASEQRMRRFIGDASHELRTPLSTLRGYAELYRMGAVTDPEQVTGTFKRIEDESTRMQALVEDLVRLARLDESRPLRLGSVDLLVLALDAEHDATALAPERPVRACGLDGASHPGSALVTGDEQQLRQVVTNLMTNAIRYTPDGSAIEVAVGTRGDHAVLRVIDHGPGVPTELAERIFERFFRADHSRSRLSGGTGLGLAIVAAIVAAHNGTARVIETPGGGATFEVWLPVRRALPGNSQTAFSQGPVTPS